MTPSNSDPSSRSGRLPLLVIYSWLWLACGGQLTLGQEASGDAKPAAREVARKETLDQMISAIQAGRHSEAATLAEAFFQKYPVTATDPALSPLDSLLADAVMGEKDRNLGVDFLRHLVQNWVDVPQTAAQPAHHARHLLGWALQRAGNLSAAEVAMRTAMEQRQTVHGGKHPLTLSSTRKLAEILRAQNKNDEAEPLLLKALEGCRVTYDPGHQYRDLTTSNLAELYADNGDWEQAQLYWKEAADGREARFGKAHHLTLHGRRRQARMLRFAGEVQASHAILEEVVEHVSILTADQKGDLAWCHAEMALTLLKLERREDAMPHCQKAFEAGLIAFPEATSLAEEFINQMPPIKGSPALYALVRAHELLADVAKSEQKWLDKRRHHLAIAAIFEIYQEPPLENIADELYAAADAVRAMPRKTAKPYLAEAITDALRARSIQERVLPAEHTDLGNTLWTLSMLWASNGELADARENFAKIMKLRVEHFGAHSEPVAAAFRGQAWIEHLAEKAENRERLLREGLNLLRQLDNPGPWEFSQQLSELADCLEDQKRFPEAHSLRREALELRRRAYGDRHGDTLSAINFLAWNCRTMGNYTEAEQLYQELLELRREQHGADSLPVAEALDQIGYLHEKMEQPIKAVASYREVLRIRESLLPFGHEDILETWGDLASALEDTASWDEAVRFAELAAHHVRQKMQPGENAWNAITYRHSRILQKAGQETEAEALLRADAAAVEAACGSNSLEMSAALENLGYFLKRARRFEEAKSFFLQRVRVLESLPEATLKLASALDQVASVCQELVQTREMAELQQRRIGLLRGLYPNGHPDLAEALTDLGRMLWQDPPAALPLFEEAYQMYAATLGPEHITTRECLMMRTSVLPLLGDFAEADKLLRTILPLIEKYSGRDSVEFGILLAFQSIVGAMGGDLSKALDNAQESWQILEAHGADATVPSFIVDLLNLMTGDRESGIGDMERFLSKVDERGGSSRQDNAGLALMLGLFYQENEQWEAATRWMEKAAQWAGESESRKGFNWGYYQYILAMQSVRNGDMASAETCALEALQSMDESIGLSLIARQVTPLLAAIKIVQGQTEEARELAVKMLAIQATHMRNLLAFASEEQRIDNLGENHGINTLDVCFTLQDPTLAATAILRTKGLALESIAEEHRFAHASGDETLKELVAAVYRERERAAQAADLLDTSALEALQAELSRQVSGLGEARRFLEITPGDISAVLPDGCCLVEFARHASLEGTSFSAALIGRDVVNLVHLGEAATIETRVTDLLTLIRDPASKEQNLHSALQELHTTLLNPIIASLPENTRTVILSPDGILNFVPFPSLLDAGGRYVAERLDVRFVSAGRDLLRATSSLPDERQWLGLADPEYDLQQKAQPTNAQTDPPWLTQAEAQGLQFRRLEGTVREIEALEILVKKHGIKANMLVGAEAREARLLETSSPYILHLSTHGFFLNDVGQSPVQQAFAQATRGVAGIRPTKSTTTPSAFNATDMANQLLGQPKGAMDRSGLALAGANKTLAAWQRSEALSPFDDGILTAREVVNWNLQGTWLVVLAACDTATGHLQSAEGVMGLKRGFLQAGARNLVTTLWEIRDHETVGFMEDFYREMLESGNPSAALSTIQKRWLIRLREERGLAEAIRIAAPFVLNFTGSP